MVSPFHSTNFCIECLTSTPALQELVSSCLWIAPSNANHPRILHDLHIPESALYKNPPHRLRTSADLSDPRDLRRLVVDKCDEHLYHALSHRSESLVPLHPDLPLLAPRLSEVQTRDMRQVLHHKSSVKVCVVQRMWAILRNGQAIRHDLRLRRGAHLH